MHFFQLCTAPHTCILICPLSLAVGIKRGSDLFDIFGTPLVFNPSIKLIENDIREQGTDNSTLRGALRTLNDLSIWQDHFAVENFRDNTKQVFVLQAQCLHLL